MNNTGDFYFLGDTVAPVRELQGWLRALSRENAAIPAVYVDGIFGSETREAVAAFQRESGLDPSGEVDVETFNAVYAAYILLLEGTEVLGYAPDFSAFRDGKMSLGDEFDDIFVLQTMLNAIALEDKRYYVKPSGRYDAETEASVNLFRRAVGRAEADFVDAALWNELVRKTRRPQYYT